MLPLAPAIPSAASTAPDEADGSVGEELLEQSKNEAGREENANDFRSRLLKNIKIAELNKKACLWCCPNGIGVHNIPLLLVFVAFALTVCGCFVCSYFSGATTGFAGSHSNYAGSNYGLWSFEDISGKCVPWDVLFYHESLDGYFRAARAVGMVALILGWCLTIVMSQALQCYLVSWAVGTGMFLWFIASFEADQLWTDAALFGLLFTIVLVVLVRSILCHRVHRRISRRGSKYIALLLILCSFLCIMTLLAKKSDFCQCKHLTVEKLEGGLVPVQDPCEKKCPWGPAAVTMIFASVTYIAAGLAVFKFGIQSDRSKTDVSTKDDQQRFDLNSYDEEAGNEEEKERTELGEAEDDEFHRTCCQRICCDFRVTKRSRKEKAFFWISRLFLVAIFALFLFSIVTMIGSRLEQNAAEKSPSTASSFITNVTCAFNASDPSAPFVTYNTPEEAAADNMTVAHCGPCACCSNMDDIETYVTTRKTITVSAKRCGPDGLFGSREDVDQCLKEQIGMTDDCRSCWVENIKCDVKRCLFTCLKTLLTGTMSQNTVDRTGDESRLNWCLQCDERRCGTGFVACSGSARRRLGIESAIERDPAELCPHVEFDWDSYPF